VIKLKAKKKSKTKKKERKKEKKFKTKKKTKIPKVRIAIEVRGFFSKLLEILCACLFTLCNVLSNQFDHTF
jgi:hypothetical protein